MMEEDQCYPESPCGGGGLGAEESPAEGVVSALASALYAEMERLVSAHGEDAASGMVPLVVTALESLQEAYSEGRARDDEASSHREDHRRLLEEYQRERQRRQAAQERCLELEDILDFERKSQRVSLQRAAQMTREMEHRARSYVDTVSQLEEEKSSLDQEYKKLSQKYNRLTKHLRDLQELSQTQEPDSLIHVRFRDLESFSSCPSDQEDEGIPVGGARLPNDLPETQSLPPSEEDHPQDPLEPPSDSESREGDRGSETDQIPEAESGSQPPQDRTESPPTSPVEHTDVVRNSDSILTEFRDLGLDLIAEVDKGIHLVDLNLQMELLTSERTQLNDQNLQEGASERVRGGTARAESRTFSQAEMTLVLTERNIYKQKLLELQEALHRMDRVRALKEHQNLQQRKSSLWERFSRFLSGPPQTTLPSPRPMAPGTPRRDSSQNPAAGGETSAGKKWRELYGRVRSHIWRELGRAQEHGWSLPPKEIPRGQCEEVPQLVQIRLLDQTNPNAKLRCAVRVPTPDSEGPRLCEGVRETLWLYSGVGSDTEVLVVDGSNTNRVRDHFLLRDSQVVCATTVSGNDGMGDTVCQQPLAQGHNPSQRDRNRASTVWIGTCSGSLFILASSFGCKRTLHTLTLSDTVHSITYTRDRVVVTLGDGAVEIFHRTPGGSWEVRNHHRVALAESGLPVPCSAAVDHIVWCGVGNRICIIDPQGPQIQRWLEVSREGEGPVSLLAPHGLGVWVALQQQPLLRLFDAQTGHPLQEFNIQPFITRTFGYGPPLDPPVGVTALSALRHRLWIGTDSGFVLSAPLSAEPGTLPPAADDAASPAERQMPLVQKPLAQISFHGHRGAVRFFASLEGTEEAEGRRLTLRDRTLDPRGRVEAVVVSGGEGYVNFRIGDDTPSPAPGGPRTPKQERSHLVVWASRA